MRDNPYWATFVLMENRYTLHIVAPSSRVRAQLSTMAFDLGYHAEVYGGLDEICECSPGAGLILARDEPASGGIARLLAELPERGCWLPVVAIGSEPTSEQIVLAMKAGAIDYLTLPLSHDRLDDTLSRIGGEARELGAARRKMIEARERIAGLSTREKEVLELLTRGQSNKAIARQLDISPRTVEIHRANMMDKIGASHAVEAVRLRLEAEIDPRKVA